MDDEDGFSATPTPQQNPLVTLAKENVALLVPVAGVLVFAFRCFVVTGGDPYVASILAAETSVGDAIRALLFTAVPALLFGIWLGAAHIASKRIITRGWREPQTLGLLLVSPATFLGVWYFSGASQRGSEVELDASGLALGAILPLILGLLYARESRERDSDESSPIGLVRFLKDVALGRIGFSEASTVYRSRSMQIAAISMYAFFVSFVILYFGLILAAQTFWRPRERLVFRNEVPFTGYVLKVSEDQLVILNDKPRVIVQKERDALEDRDFCYPEGHKARSSKVAADSPTCP